MEKRSRYYGCERLIEKGFNEIELSKIHAPIGLDIKAKTPAEIATSILAEIINYRRNNHD